MADSGFEIDGREYPIPGFETFDLDEAMVLYECCGMTLEDFVVDQEDEEQLEALAEKTRHPGFIRALMIVAFMRGNEGVSVKKAQSVIGGSNLFEAYKNFLEAGGAEDPTEPQPKSESSEASPASSSGSGRSSGRGSTKSSASPDAAPASTGTGE